MLFRSLSLLMFGGIEARLYYLQVRLHHHYSQLAVAQQERSFTLNKRRGDILDRNGQILATDVRAPSLFAEPRRIIDLDEAVELLTAVLPDLDATELRASCARQKPHASRSLSLPGWKGRMASSQVSAT